MCDICKAMGQWICECSAPIDVTEFQKCWNCGESVPESYVREVEEFANARWN